MEEPQIRTFDNLGEAEKQLRKEFNVGDSYFVTGWVGSRIGEPDQQLLLVLQLSGHPRPPILAWSPRQLVEFAKQILRTYEPTVEEKILDALNEIKARLPEPPPKEN